MKNRLLPLLLILLLAGLLTPVFQDFVGYVFVTPFLYLFWVGRLIFEAIPQIITWGLFLVIALTIALYSLLKHRPPLRRSQRAFKTAHQERIETWLKLIERTDQETYYQWQLAQHLRKLTLAILAHDERLPTRQIQQRLTEGELDIPPEIEAYLQASLTSFSHLSDLIPRSRLRKTASPLDPDLEQIAQFLEKRLD